MVTENTKKAKRSAKATPQVPALAGMSPLGMTEKKTVGPAPADPTMGIPWGKGAEPAKVRKTRAKKAPAAPKNIHLRVAADGSSRCGRSTGTRVDTMEETTCGYCKNLGPKTMDEAAADGAKAKAGSPIWNTPVEGLLEDPLQVARMAAIEKLNKATTTVGLLKTMQEFPQQLKDDQAVIDACNAYAFRLGKIEDGKKAHAEKESTMKTGSKKTSSSAAAKTSSKKAAAGERDPRLPKSGTKLSRERQGKTYECTVLADGYLYKGKEYSSLSAISNEITGTNTNGFLWWGLTKPADLVDKAKGKICALCGCTELDACPGGCSWLSKDMAAAQGFPNRDLCNQCLQPVTSKASKKKTAAA